MLNYDASKYSADRNYASRTDAAYISKYGVAPGTVSAGVAKVNETFTTLMGSGWKEMPSGNLFTPEVKAKADHFLATQGKSKAIKTTPKTWKTLKGGK